jgi:hypothetical protein
MVATWGTSALSSLLFQVFLPGRASTSVPTDVAPRIPQRRCRAISAATAVVVWVSAGRCRPHASNPLAVVKGGRRSRTRNISHSFRPHAGVVTQIAVSLVASWSPPELFCSAGLMQLKDGDLGFDPDHEVAAVSAPARRR